MTRKILPLIFLLLTTSIVKAQVKRTCGTMEHLESQIAADPSLAEKMKQQESQLQQWIKNNQNKKSGVVITIPVVVHVVYRISTQNMINLRVNYLAEVL